MHDLVFCEHDIIYCLHAFLLSEKLCAPLSSRSKGDILE